MIHDVVILYIISIIVPPDRHNYALNDLFISVRNLMDI